jgi:hypothetical protein
MQVLPKSAQTRLTEMQTEELTGCSWLEKGALVLPVSTVRLSGEQCLLLVACIAMDATVAATYLERVVRSEELTGRECKTSVR